MVWAVFSARCRACKHQTGVSGTGHEMSARTQEIGGRGHLEARSSPWWSSPEEAGDTQPSAAVLLYGSFLDGSATFGTVMCFVDSSSVNIFSRAPLVFLKATCNLYLSNL